MGTQGWWLTGTCFVPQGELGLSGPPGIPGKEGLMGPKVGQGSAGKSCAGASAACPRLLVPHCLPLPLHRATGDSMGSREPKETRGKKETG